MIPLFGKEGFLPPGIHVATLYEFENRFANTVWRKGLFEYLIKLINDLRLINCQAIYVDGSYVTTKRVPSDLDICWDDSGMNYDYVEMKLPILFDLDYPRTNQQLIYRSDIFPAYLYEANSKKYFIDFFQQDKNTGLPKGIIKIEIL